MLQRSPTFFLARPRTHELANTLRALDVPEEWTHEILRRAHIAELNELTRMSFETPEELRTLLIEGMRAQLPPGYDVDKHFNPSATSPSASTRSRSTSRTRSPTAA
jgi:cation diffusion facilitator CzcD-associated flavoprotein CzcO